jgi:excisionase family DNA binding protein
MAADSRPLVANATDFGAGRDRPDGLDGALTAALGPLVDMLVERVAERAAELLPPAANQSPWLDADGAADYIAASRDRIYDLVALRKLEPRRDGRRLLFRRDELDAYLEASR